MNKGLLCSVSRGRLQRAALGRRAGHRQHEAQSEGLLSGWSVQTHHHQTHRCQLVSTSCLCLCPNVFTCLCCYFYKLVLMKMATFGASKRSFCFVFWCRDVIQYDDPRISLVHTDFEKLENKPAPVFNTGTFILGLILLNR